MKLNNLYGKLPVFLQNCAVSLYGLIRENKRFGGNYKRHFKQVQQSEFYDVDKMSILKKIQLKALFESASSSKYYGKLFADLSINAQNDDPFEVLKKLPVLEKNILRGTEDSFYTASAKKSFVFHTSGSTGTPLNIKMSKSDFRLRMALLERQKRRYGVSRHSKHLTFVGKK